MTDLAALRARLRAILDGRAPYVWRITPDEMRMLLDSYVPRYPTKAMSEAGWAEAFRYTNGTNHLMGNGLEAAWCAMYDAALADQSAQVVRAPGAGKS